MLGRSRGTLSRSTRPCPSTSWSTSWVQLVPGNSQQVATCSRTWNSRTFSQLRRTKSYCSTSVGLVARGRSLQHSRALGACVCALWTNVVHLPLRVLGKPRVSGFWECSYSTSRRLSFCTVQGLCSRRRCICFGLFSSICPWSRISSRRRSRCSPLGSRSDENFCKGLARGRGRALLGRCFGIPSCVNSFPNLLV